MFPTSMSGTYNNNFMKLKVAYIIGKISGLPIEEAKQNFEIKKKHLLDNGYDEVEDPINLMSEIRHLLPSSINEKEEWQWGMTISLQFMLNARCVCLSTDAELEIHPLLNWKNSKGALIEVELSEKLGIKVVYPSFTVRPKAPKRAENVQNGAL